MAFFLELNSFLMFGSHIIKTIESNSKLNMDINIIIFLSLLIIALFNYKKILSFIDHLEEKRAIEFKNRTNLDLYALTRISAPPVLLFFGLENFFLNRSVFYFDENNLYKITRKDPVIQHKLSSIIEARKTSVMVNERRVWKIIIKDSDKQIGYRITSRHNNFNLFLEKISENPNIIMDERYSWKIFE